jgi:anti-sigma B factor antagonist
MEINVRELNDVAILELEGRLDASTVNNLRDKLKNLIQHNHSNIVLDLGNISFIDSSGIGILVASLRSINEINGDIKISNVKDHVRSIFELTRLHHIFEIFDDCEIAALSFSPK